ncbi:MAG TPA: FAD-dependent oxidoreductase, partial [Victivallales bacterium]|nr:FAD-dependent oxidoreductase [Victivallales bacterium]
MKRILERAKFVKINGEYDICIIGGSCTGVFAAIRASRLGAKVVIIEKMNSFGGVATQGLVNVWHSLYDTEWKKQIIAGLSLEIIERLKRRNAVIEKRSNSTAFILNTEELKIELDQIICENRRITPMLHTLYCAPYLKDGRLLGVFIENKDGRQLIKAKIFIDASGDGDLAYHLKVPQIHDGELQPPTTCAKIRNLCPDKIDLKEMIKKHREEFGLAKDFGWNGEIPGADDIRMYAETHVFKIDASKANQLTEAEIEGRRQIRAIMDIFRKYAPSRKMQLLALPSQIGIRETRRFKGEYLLKGNELLNGEKFDDAIANGSYCIDVHNASDGGFIFRYLDGTEEQISFSGYKKTRWRPETESNPTFYQIPYRIMLNKKVDN